jgi:hypothetical protein
VACGVGGLCAAAVFAWVVFGGRVDPLAMEALGGFYDAQARSLLHGHWDVSAAAVSFERFTVHGRYYMYFGPWPAVLRTPVVAFTHEFDGRLSRVSMLLAFVVLVGFAGRLAWQARVALRGTSPIGWRGLLAASGFVFVVGCGSSALFLASRAFVYHEAILWAASWSVAAFSCIVAYLTSGRGWSLVWACVTATLALLSRPSVGLGPVMALGLVLAVRVVQRLGDWRMTRRPSGRLRARRVWPARWLGVTNESAHGALWPVAVAIAVPIAFYAYVNYAKFGTLFTVPYEKQDILAQVSPERRAALAATGNRLFGIDYVPTNLVQYFRPDAIGFRSTFPWITFAHTYPLHGLAFDPLEPFASLTATAVLLFVLSLLGSIAVVRSRPESDDITLPAESRPNARRFRLPLVGAAAVIGATTLVSSQAFRYETDFLPILVIAGSLGLFWLGTQIAGATRAVRAVVTVALVVVAAWSCWTMFGLALISQREYSGFQSTAVRAGFVGFQLDVNDALGLSFPSVRRGSQLPVLHNGQINRTNAPHGELFVVGPCEGLFIATGRSWEPIEQRLPGERRWSVSFGDGAPRGSREPLWSAGTGPYHIIWARWLDGSHVRLEYEWTGAPDAIVMGTKSLRVVPGKEYDLDARVDAASGAIEIRHAGDVLLAATTRAPDAARRAHVGRQPLAARGAARWRGRIENDSVTPVCDRLTDRVGA